MHLEPDYGTGSALRRSRTDDQATTVPMTNAEAAHNPAAAYSPRDTDRLPKWQAIAAQTLASSVATINTNPTDDSSGLNPSGEQLPTRAPEAVTENWGHNQVAVVWFEADSPRGRTALYTITH